jgi:hypothetical protein
VPKDGRIIDERTGQSCDYAALANECLSLSQTKGISWRHAAEQVAREANADRAESIVRHLNRKRPDDRKALLILPGEAVLYDAIDRQLDYLEKRIPDRDRVLVSDILGSTSEPFARDRPFAELASQAASIRTLLQQREEALKALTEVESIRGAESVLCGVEQGSLSPRMLIQNERGRLSVLITRVRQLQRKIDEARPGPYFVGGH